MVLIDSFLLSLKVPAYCVITWIDHGCNMILCIIHVITRSRPKVITNLTDSMLLMCTSKIRYPTLQCSQPTCCSWKAHKVNNCFGSPTTIPAFCELAKLDLFECNSYRSFSPRSLCVQACVALPIQILFICPPGSTAFPTDPLGVFWLAVRAVLARSHSHCLLNSSSSLPSRSYICIDVFSLAVWSIPIDGWLSLSFSSPLECVCSRILKAGFQTRGMGVWGWSVKVDSVHKARPN